MSSSSRRDSVRWLKDSLEEHQEELGYKIAPAKINGADFTFTVYEGNVTINLYYLDTVLTKDVMHKIINRNTKQEISTLFVCDASILPKGDQNSITDKYDDFCAIQQLLTDGRIHVWDGTSIVEWHYERVYAIDSMQRKLYRGSTIDVSGLQVIESTYPNDVIPNPSASVRFSYKKWWEAPKEDPFAGYRQSGFNQGGYTGYGKTWEEFFRQNFYDQFRQQQQQRADERYWYGGQRQQPTHTRPNGSSDYDVLGISPSATDADVKAAYRKLMRQWHPDTNPDKVDEATERSKAINKAYANIKTQRGIK